MKVLGFTGTRNGLTKKQTEVIKVLLTVLRPTEFHHGDCIGSDAEMHKLVQGYGSLKTIIIHPPEKDVLQAHSCKLKTNSKGVYILSKEKKYFLDRNRDIVDECDVLLAAPKEQEEVTRSGTWSTIRYARKQKRKLIVVLPDGSTKTENFPENKQPA